ncbi:uncharacterized protein LOC135822498 [Sycon ciliatum]|uniref:uncharacterized protein LOC135822498 n=1 Tax=Sycon ciliatum TaxID=27933 RepID=UPI0031F70D32
MGVLTYCVVLALALIAVIHGQPDPGTGFNAKLSKTLTIRKTGWTSLTGYSTAKDGARLKFVRTGFNFANGVYTVPKSGVYFVSAQVSIQNGNVGYFRLLVAINSQNNVHNSMHAIKSNAKWYIYSMHVNGFLYLSEGDTIVANVFSQRDTLFQMLTTSSFSAMYMGPVFQHVGFSADLWGSRSFRKTGWSEITGYSTTAYNYLWNNGDGFSTSSGRFTAPCDGVYYVAGNIRMDGANGNYFRLVASVNGSSNTNAGLASVEGVPRAPYYTQNVGGAVHLNKGDWISLWVYSDNDNTFVMQSESSFHVMFLGPRSASAPAFMADLNRVITIPNTNPYKLTVYRTTGAPGLYATSGFNAGSGTFFVPFTGLYAVSFLVRFNNAKGLTQAYINAGGPSAGNNYVYASRSWATSRAMDSFTLKGSAVVYLTQGNQVSVYVRCAVKNCQIGTESSFSAALLGPNLPHPGVHADVARDTRITTKWAKASVWNTAFATGTGLYATDGNWDGTQYIAATPGIYYVACNLRLDYATRSPLTRATIAINDKYDYAHGIHGVDSSGAAFVTFTMSGFVRLKSGDTVSVWAYSDDTSYTLSTMSGFSVNRMGSAFDLPSFLADLNTNQTISKTVYTPLANWNANAGYGTFTTGFSFDEPSGVFTAPYTGKYVVTANIRFDNVKANAYYRVVICPYTSATAFSCSVNSGLHSIRGTLATPPKYFSESVQATIPLTAGQRIGVFVFGNKVPYTVNSESGFSACFIPGNPYGFNGDLNGNFNLAPTSGSTWREVRRAFRVKDSRTPQLWSTGFTQATGSMTIPSDGTGVYIVSANIRFDRASGNNFRLLIAINDVRTTANGLSSMQGTPVNTYFSQQVVGTVYLKGGSRISLYIYNTRTTATFSLQSESGFSAVMVSGNQYTRPSFLADLVSTVNIIGTGWKLVTNYMFHSAQFYTWGLHKFGNGTFSKGYYKIPQSGIWYLSGNLRLNAAGGRYTRLVLAINGQYTLNGGLHSITGPPSASYYTLHVAGAIQVTAGQTISMWLYSNSDPSYSVDTESSFSAFFLGAPNLFPGFNVDMAGSVRRGRGVQRPASFRTTGANGLFSSVPATNLDLRTGTFTAPYAGVYLVSCSLRLDNAGTGYFRTMISINGSLSTTQPTLSAVKSGSLHASYHTTNIFGALQLAKGAKIAPVTQSTADTSWNFQHESGWSAVYIGAAGQVSGMTSKGAYSRRVTNLGGRWLQLGYWDVSAPGFFGDEYFQPYGGRYTTPNAGKYYVSANIRLDNVDSGYIYSKILINNNLSGRSRITSLMGNQVSGGQPNTLSMSGVLYLPAFTYISIAIVASSDNDFMINGDSTFSVIYLGTNDNPECVKGGPVIAVHPLDTQVFVGDPLVLNCRALSVPPATLSWYFNGALVPGQTSETFSVTASNSGAGNYQCRATANGRTVNSFTAAVVVYGHDGTVPGFAADVLSTVTLTNQMAKWYTVTRWRVGGFATGTVPVLVHPSIEYEMHYAATKPCNHCILHG